MISYSLRIYNIYNNHFKKIYTRKLIYNTNPYILVYYLEYLFIYNKLA